MKKQFIALFVLLGCANVNAIEQIDGVYQINTAKDLTDFAALVNAGTTNANAMLTADIDMSTESASFPMIGTSASPYAGTFDGQFHTISNLVLDREQGDVALVSYAQPGCTIKNLILDETCSASGASHTAGIVSRFTGAHNPIYLLNLGYEGTITDLGVNAGGIHSNSPSGGPITVMRNCYSTGKVNGTKENGQLSGWVGRDAIVENCWSTAEVTGVESDEFYMYRRGTATQTNCYSKYGTQATLITDEQVASGELCFKLNGDQTAINFYQTIGEDAHPVLSPAHGTVYPESRLHCDGTPYESTGIYSNKEVSQDEHDFQKGICTQCGKINTDYKQKNADGYYELSEGGDLVWFAALVNGGTTSANAVLTADIDMADYSDGFAMIGTSGNPYAGVFDGQFHTISNLNLNREQGDVALVSYAQPGCTIKNLVLDETCSASGKSHTAGIVSRFTGSNNPIYLLNLGYEGTINDLGVNAGGIHSNSPSGGPITVMRNCYSTGKVNGTKENGQLSGWVGRDAIVENCWSTAEVTGVESDEFYMYRRGTATQTNCYSKYGTQATLITDEQVASGELCFKLNGDQTAINFYQTIGEDAHPVLSPAHGTVYPESRLHCDGTPYESTGIYSNKEASQDEHDFQKGICTQCGKINTDYKQKNADGYYELSEGGDLVWFAALINNGTTNANAVLTADIDMAPESASFPMIGTSGNPYAGVFDGQFHTISNLVLNREQGDVALVSYAQPGCTIKNLTLDETCSASGASHTAGIVSRFTGSHNPIYLLNLGYEGTINDLGVNAGGIHSNSPSGGPITVMRNCYSTGKVNGTKENGQLSGWVGRDAIVENCWSTAEVTGVESDEFYMYRRGTATQTNCYSKYGTQATLITDEQVASGELTYLLNQGNVQNPVWRQSIGYDAAPIFTTTHGIVNKIGATGYATQYIAESNVQIPEGVTAFTGVIDAPWLVLKALSDIIPAGEAVVLQGEAGFYSFIPATESGIIEDNDLKGAAEAFKASGTQYVLAEKDGAVGFYKAEGTIPAGKAYIEYAGAGVKGFFFGDATGLTSPLFQGEGDSAAMYDLSGRRVEKAQKGIYIINGKKVLK